MKIAYCDNTWGGTLTVAMPGVQSCLNVRSDFLHDEILIW